MIFDFSNTFSFRNGEVYENTVKIEGDYWDKIREILKDVPEDYRKNDFFSGGVLGLVSYDYNRFLEKKPYNELNLKFDSFEKEMKYKEKYLKAAIHLKQKKIGLPVGFYKKIKAGKHKECYYVPNEELKSNLTIEDFKVDCGIF